MDPGADLIDVKFCYDHDLSVRYAKSGLSIDRLRSFLEVANAGAIALAAPKHPVRQSQLSRQISELEEFFGQALVQRRGRGIALTAAGERLAITVREMLQGFEDVAASGGSPSLSATLGAGDSLVQGLIISHGLAALEQSLARALTLTLVTVHGRDAAAGLLDSSLDLAVMRASDVPRLLRTRPLGLLDYALFVPRKLLGSSRSVPPLKKVLATVPFVAQYGDPEIASALVPLLEEVGVPAALHVATFPQAQRAVATKRFATVLPTLARLELPPAEYLELPLALAFTRKVVLAWHPRLERQRPELAALLPKIAHALQLPGAS